MRLLQFLTMITIVYVLYIDQAFTNIPGFSIAVYLLMDIALIYYHFKLRLQGGLWKELSYEGKTYLVFFAVIFIPGLLLSPDVGSYLHSFFKGFEYAILFISVYYIAWSKKSIDFVLVVLAISIFAYALTTYFNGMVELGTGRLVISERANPNDLGIYMSIGFVLITYFWNKGLIYKILSIGFIPIALSNITLSGSRKGFIGVAIFIVLFMVSSVFPSISRKNVFRVLIGLAIVTCLVIILYNRYAPMYSSSVLFERLNQSLSSEDNSSQIRMGMYKQAFELFLQYPIFGVGYDNFKYFSGFGMFSHSTYAEVLSCTGIIGTFLYFSIYVSILYKTLKLYFEKIRHKLSVYYEGIILSFMILDLVYSLVRIDLYDPIIYCIFGCIVGYLKINKKGDLSYAKNKKNLQDAI